MKISDSVILHADDYGTTRGNTENILALVNEGHLTSLSIMHNGCLEYAAKKPELQNVAVYLHLNLVEGESLCKNEVLCDQRGYFKKSFFPLLIESILHPKRLYAAAYEEFSAQIKAVSKALGDVKLYGLDTHQHTHAIPAVMKALLAAARDSGADFRAVRLTNEPLLPFLTTACVAKTLSPVNIVKNLVLKSLSIGAARRLKRDGYETALLCGVAMSGHMNARVESLLPKLERKAAKKGLPLMLLFHPGFLSEDEAPLDPENEGFAAFATDAGRREEYDFLTTVTR